MSVGYVVVLLSRLKSSLHLKHHDLFSMFLCNTRLLKNSWSGPWPLDRLSLSDRPCSVGLVNLFSRHIHCNQKFSIFVHSLLIFSIAIELGHLLTLHVEIGAFSVDRIVIVVGCMEVFVSIITHVIAPVKALLSK